MWPTNPFIKIREPNPRVRRRSFLFTCITAQKIEHDVFKNTIYHPFDNTVNSFDSSLYPFRVACFGLKCSSFFKEMID